MGAISTQMRLAVVALAAAGAMFTGPQALDVAATAVRSSGPEPAGPSGVIAPSVIMGRALAEVETAIDEAGPPPCGAVQVSVEATPDGRSWAWPGLCQILLDARLVAAGGGAFAYVVRHEVAHLHAGTNHFDPRFRALETKLATYVGYDLSYAPGAEYADLAPRAR